MESTHQFNSLPSESDVNLLLSKDSPIVNQNCNPKINYQSPISSAKLRVKRYWKEKNFVRKICSETVIHDLSVEFDPRPRINVRLANAILNGLLDSGATISILGKNCISLLSGAKVDYQKFKSFCLTADGSQNAIVGFVWLNVTYLERTERVKFFLVPTLTEELYLGINFWNAFDIFPKIVNDISIESVNPEIINQHHLTPAQLDELEVVKKEFPSYEELGLGRTNLYVHQIDVESAQPIKQRHYPVSPAVQKLLYEELDRMLSLDLIETSNSPWSSPVVLVKKSNGKMRLCLDSRKINSVTVKDSYPLPHIDGLLGRLSVTKYISSLDLKDAFYQIPLAEKSRLITAFAVPGRPLYQYKVMPMGLCNSPQSMCRLMDLVIPNELRDRVFVYLDDLLIISATYNEHIALLKHVALLLRNANLTINVDKSFFMMSEIKYLGFLVGEKGLRPDPNKVTAIVNFPTPISVKQTRRLLGMAGWYRRFIPNFADISAPITELLKKGKKFLWSNEAQLAFEEIKHLLSTAPILITPDYNKPFYIRCDASTEGVGGVLFQLDEFEQEKPIAFISQKLRAAQRNYSVSEQECLAALVSVKKFRPYIEGHDFTIITDHANLKWLMSQKDLSGRLARWSLKLQGYNFKIVHQKGTDNIVPDALSRIYCDSLIELDASTKLVDSIDMTSKCFLDSEYVELLDKIKNSSVDFPNLAVKDDKIYIRIEPKSHVSLVDIPIWKLWVPASLVPEILNFEHNDPNSAHGGIKKTLEKIRRVYYWPRMAQQIKEYIQECEVCKSTKHPNIITRPLMGISKNADRPWQKLYIDFLGPYPRSKFGNTVIFIVLDDLTKFTLLKAMPKASASNVIKYLKEMFGIFGVPEIILSDNGSQFRSHEFASFLSEIGITSTFTAVYSPQANASERVNRSIVAAIRGYVGENHRNWDCKLVAIGSALRNSVHESTGYSPHFLMFGYHQIQHGNSYKLLRNLNCMGESEIETLSRQVRMALIFEDVIKHLEQAKLRSAKGYNLRARAIEFMVGQTVWVRQHPQSNAVNHFSAKFAPVYKEGVVKERLGNVLYKVCSKDGKLMGTFHAKDLKS